MCESRRSRLPGSVVDQSFVLELHGWPVCERFVQPDGVEPADVFDDRQLERVRVFQTRSAISSVLKESTKLSASALS